MATKTQYEHLSKKLIEEIREYQRAKDIEQYGHSYIYDDTVIITKALGEYLRQLKGRV